MVKWVILHFMVEFALAMQKHQKICRYICSVKLYGEILEFVCLFLGPYSFLVVGHPIACFCKYLVLAVSTPHLDDQSLI